MQQFNVFTLYTGQRLQFKNDLTK